MGYLLYQVFFNSGLVNNGLKGLWLAALRITLGLFILDGAMPIHVDLA
jgi:hypothetical protein